MMMAEPASFVTNNEAMYHQDQMNQFGHQVDPQSRMAPGMAVGGGGGGGGGGSGSGTDVGTVLMPDRKQFMRGRLMQSMRQPLLVTASVYLLFNPLVYAQLQRVVPSIFGSTNSTLIRHVRILIMAVLIGILYAILQRLVR